MNVDVFIFLPFIQIYGMEVWRMGYFSELAIDNDYCEDYSYPSPEMKLKWRIEDLKDRLDEISKGNYGITAHYFMGCQFSEEDLAYTPPEYFSRASDILAAISSSERGFPCSSSNIGLSVDTDVMSIELWNLLPALSCTHIS